MTEAQFLAQMRPGDWAVDHSAHRYNRKVRFRWDARDAGGRLRHGYARTYEAAERSARNAVRTESA